MSERVKIFEGNCTGVCQLIDSPHKVPIELWKKGCSNNWMPQAVNMSDDTKQWKQNDCITDDERLLVKRTLGLFSAGESLVSNSVMLNEFKYVTDGACRQYMLRKAYEESLHNFTVSTVCDAYSLSIKEVGEAYKNIESITAKDAFLERSLRSLDNKDFDINTLEGKQLYTKNLVVFYLICEGLWFYPNFAMILAMGRQNKLKNLCSQIDYTLRDETNHLEFGVYLIDVIKSDYPEIWTEEFKTQIIDLVKEAVELEIIYAKEILPNGILGVNYTMLVDYVKFIANRRFESVGLDYRYDVNRNPFPWLGEAQDADTMTAFFEVRNKNYQHAGSLVDDL